MTEEQATSEHSLHIWTEGDDDVVMEDPSGLVESSQDVVTAMLLAA